MEQAAIRTATVPSAASSWRIRPARPREVPKVPKSLATWRMMTGAHRVILLDLPMDPIFEIMEHSHNAAAPYHVSK